jgi:type IV fimbrial biogenesis protein FimT
MQPISSFRIHRARRNDGFTLIELLVTIAIAATIAALAVPAFNNFVMDDRDAAEARSLEMSFNYARSEALKRNTIAGVQVCPSSDGLTCNNPAAGWIAGWVVYDMDPSDPTPALQATPALANVNALTATGAGATGITFTSGGRALAGAKIKICDPRGSAHARDIEVNLVGTVLVSQAAGQDAYGNPLACP